MILHPTCSEDLQVFHPQIYKILRKQQRNDLEKKKNRGQKKGNGKSNVGIKLTSPNHFVSLSCISSIDGAYR